MSHVVVVVVCIVVIDGISTRSSLFYPVRAFQVPMSLPCSPGGVVSELCLGSGVGKAWPTFLTRVPALYTRRAK